MHDRNSKKEEETYSICQQLYQLSSTNALNLPYPVYQDKEYFV